MTIREGKWKCTYCDAVNLGRELKCGSCTATRDKDVKFIYDEDAPEVTDTSLLERATGGAEWLCETCGCSNVSNRQECKQCGAPKGGSKSRDVKMVDPPQVAAQAVTKPSGSGKKAIGVVAAVVFLLAICAVSSLLLVFKTHQEQFTVSSVKWERTIDVEEIRTETAQDWEDQVPSDARVLSRSRQFHHNEKIQTGTRSVQRSSKERVKVGTKRVKVGTKDLGNGYFKDIYEDRPVYEDRTVTKTVQEPVYRDEPIYKNRVTYQVDRWRVIRTEKTSGNDNSPKWPDVVQTAKTRAGKKSEKYLVNFMNEKGKLYEHSVKDGEFAQFTPGAKFLAKVNTFGSISELKPAR